MTLEHSLHRVAINTAMEIVSACPFLFHHQIATAGTLPQWKSKLATLSRTGSRQEKEMNNRLAQPLDLTQLLSDLVA